MSDSRSTATVTPTDVPVSALTPALDARHEHPPMSVPAPTETKLTSQAEKALMAAAHTETKIHDGQVSLTHGFVPHQAIPTALPAGYEAWDALSANLSKYVNLGTEREEIAKLAVLRADDVRALPDAYLSRAAAILANAAHAYYFNQRKGHTQTADPLPDCIRAPWEQIYKRLGRSLNGYEAGKLLATRNHYDAFLNNWRLSAESKAVIDGERNVDVTLDDLELLTPSFDNREEHVFNLTITLMEIRFGAAIQHFVNALKAVAEKDETKLIAALKKLTFIIGKVTEALDFLSPNEHSKHYVDPTIWTKTVAKFDGAIPGELPGLSASLLPLFHAMDCFVERYDFNTKLGLDLMKKFKTQPKNIFDFINGMRLDLEKSSLRGFVEASSNPVLKSHYSSFMDAYLGRYGLLSVHAVKAFGYMIINFRNGRLETNGGHQGTATIQTQPHKQVFNDFGDANAERLRPYRPYPQLATRKGSRAIGAGTSEIILDVSGTGLGFEAGDRVAILPQNTPTEIEFIIKKFSLNPDTEVALSPEWKKHLKNQWDIDATKLKLSELLKHADLSQLIKLEEKATFDALALKPLTERLYSVSPVVDEKEPGQIRLTIGAHAYEDSKGVLHEGVASSHLLKDKTPVRVTKAPGHMFRLPTDPSKPVLMFAGGTGVSPFMGFVDARKEQKATGKNWLFLGTKDRSTFFHEAELARDVHEGNLDLSVIFSRETDNSATYNREKRKFEFAPGHKGKYIDQLVSENVEAIATMILEQGAYVYICGSSDFADTVRAALDKALKVKIADDVERAHYIDGLIADHRLNNDVFTSPLVLQKNKGLRAISRVDVASHNSITDCWSIFNGGVYDMTKFMHTHPGGRKIIQISAGLDGSSEYNHIGHHLDPQVEALLAQYQIGVLAKPEFKTSDDAAFYDSSVKFLEALVEMENTLSNNSRYPGTDHTHLWRETISVFVDGRLASYDSIGAVGSFKFVFGSMLSGLYDKFKLPSEEMKAIYGTLSAKASSCAALLREASLPPTSRAKVECLKTNYDFVLEATAKFVHDAKGKIQALVRDIESDPARRDPERLKRLLKEIEADMKVYLHTVQKHLYIMRNMKYILALPLPSDKAMFITKHIHSQIRAEAESLSSGPDFSDTAIGKTVRDIYTKLSRPVDERLITDEKLAVTVSTPLTSSEVGGLCPFGFTGSPAKKVTSVPSTSMSVSGIAASLFGRLGSLASRVVFGELHNEHKESAPRVQQVPVEVVSRTRVTQVTPTSVSQLGLLRHRVPTTSGVSLGSVPGGRPSEPIALPQQRVAPHEVRIAGGGIRSSL